MQIHKTYTYPRSKYSMEAGVLRLVKELLEKSYTFMKNALRRAFHIFAFALLAFAIYLNFFYKGE